MFSKNTKRSRRPAATETTQAIPAAYIATCRRCIFFRQYSPCVHKGSQSNNQYEPTINVEIICTDHTCGKWQIPSVNMVRCESLTSIAYYLKEELRTLWSYHDIGHLTTFFDDWCRRAAEAGIPAGFLGQNLRGFRSAIFQALAGIVSGA